MTDFSQCLIDWQKEYGRHNLPWQNTTDPYAIWVSEIMLQQTQVTAVIGYYQKFMKRFPDIATLSEATQDEVLQHWSGLGYYSRARNLHNAAQIIMDEHQGVFPNDFTVIQTLPGIGRSTAAAIVSFAFNQVQTILDGNVKRVLTRHFAIDGWPGTPKVEKQLWALAENLLPKTEMVAYTQGLMDLGATLCTRSKPQCERCPIAAGCEALKQGRVHQLPSPKPRKSNPERNITMLVLKQGDNILLEKRPPSGIWGGLWSFPETELTDNLTQHVKLRFGMEIEGIEVEGLEVQPALTLQKLTHAFTHFKLHIQPQMLTVSGKATQMREAGQVWISIEDALGAAIPTPVRKILHSLMQNHH